jgi:serine/threonine protein kinase
MLSYSNQDEGLVMDDGSSSSSDDLASTSSDESMMGNDDDGSRNNLVHQAAERFDGREAAPEDDEERAYWIQRTIREAIYGRVLLAVILRRRAPGISTNDNAEWQVTSQLCAVKEMSWQHIRKERDRLAEDPVKEVAAMQYLKGWHYASNRQGQPLSPVGPISAPTPLRPAKQDFVADSFAAMLETNIMMPLDLLSDDRHLYSIMPYCDGGELFERLDVNEKFSEAEARYWMHQVLNVRSATGKPCSSQARS